MKVIVYEVDTISVGVDKYEPEVHSSKFAKTIDIPEELYDRYRQLREDWIQIQNKIATLANL